MIEAMDSDHDPLVVEASAALRRHAHAREQARAALVHALAEPRQHGRGERGFLWRHRLAIGVAAGIAMAVGIGEAVAHRNSAADSGPHTNTTLVEFSLDAPAARLVSVVGEFNAWDNRVAPMRRATNGRWVANLALAPGRHTYGFAIDGEELVPDPRAPVAPEQLFGVRHSVIVVSRGER